MASIIEVNLEKGSEIKTFRFGSFRKAESAKEVADAVEAKVMEASMEKDGLPSFVSVEVHEIESAEAKDIVTKILEEV